MCTRRGRVPAILVAPEFFDLSRLRPSMSSLVSASTPSRFAFASAALNLASLSCSTVPESSREGTDAGVADGLCSGFFGGSGGTGLSVVGSGSLLGGLDSFTMLGFMCFGTLPMGGVRFPQTRFGQFWKAWSRLRVPV